MAASAELSVWPPTAQPARIAVGVDRCAADPAAPPKGWIYAAPAIGFVLSGWFDYNVEERSAFAAPGAVVLGNAGEHFHVRHHDAQGNRRIFATLRQALLDEVATTEQLDDNRFRSITMAPGPATTRMLSWFRAISQGAGGAEEGEYALAHAALSAGSHQPKRVSGRNHARVSAAARYIDANFHQPCSLKTLSEAAKLSRYELIRAFTALLGQSPNQYLIHTRVRVAAERLEATATPIAEIAFDVGFNDISYFYHCFRTAFGCTPLQWRARH
jgi:AraC-like DNA-binding protein